MRVIDRERRVPTVSPGCDGLSDITMTVVERSARQGDVVGYAIVRGEGRPDTVLVAELGALTQYGLPTSVHQVRAGDRAYDRTLALAESARAVIIWRGSTHHITRCPGA